MSENEKPIFCSSFTTKPNKIFIYKEKDYNVDFDLIKRNCNYFYEHREEIEREAKYKLDISIDLPTETIQSFLNCCQNQQTAINDIVGINYLSIKYQNEELKTFTEKYIEHNRDELIFQSISFKNQIYQSNDFQENSSKINIDTTFEEEVLSSHFLDYLDDERIFSVKINILDRVFKKFLTKSNDEIDNDPSKRKKINDFLLKCLDKYKRKGSVLFSSVNFGKLDRDFIVVLHNKYDEIFDFNMINTKSLFDATYDLIGEVAKIQSQLKFVSDQQTAEKNYFSELEKKIEQELKLIRDEQQRISNFQSATNDNQTQFLSKISNFEEKQNNNSERIQTLENKKNEIESRINDLDGKHNNSSSITQTLETKKNEIERKLNDLDGKQSNLSGRLQSLDNSISQQRQNQESMQSSLNQMSQSISKFATRDILTNFFTKFIFSVLCNLY